MSRLNMVYFTQRVGKSANLTVTVTPQTAGQYWCKASTDNYQDIEAAAMVYVRGKVYQTNALKEKVTSLSYNYKRHL